MELFAGALRTLDEYSILMQVRPTFSISFKLEQSCHFHSDARPHAGKCYKFPF